MSRKYGLSSTFRGTFAFLELTIRVRLRMWNGSILYDRMIGTL